MKAWCLRMPAGDLMPVQTLAATQPEAWTRSLEWLGEVLGDRTNAIQRQKRAGFRVVEVEIAEAA